VLGPSWATSGSGSNIASAFKKSLLHQRGAFWSYCVKMGWPKYTARPRRVIAG
jgi:hypothetical protein